MEKRFIVTALLITLLSVVFSMSGDGGNVPVVKNHKSVEVKQPTDQADLSVPITENNKVILGENNSGFEHQTEIHSKSESTNIDLASLTTHDLIVLFLNSKRFIGIGAFDYIDIQQNTLIKSDIIQELLTRKDKVDEILIAYASLDSIKSSLPKEMMYKYLDLVLSSDSLIAKMTLKDKYNVLSVSYKGYLKRIESKDHFNPSIYHLFYNILDSEGYSLRKRNREKIHFSTYYNYEKELINKTVEYLKNKSR